MKALKVSGGKPVIQKNDPAIWKRFIAGGRKEIEPGQAYRRRTQSFKEVIYSQCQQ